MSQIGRQCMYIKQRKTLFDLQTGFHECLQLSALTLLSTGSFWDANVE